MSHLTTARALSLAVLGLTLAGCAELESIYKPAPTVALTDAPPEGSSDCHQPPDPKAPPPAYTLHNLRDCTAPDSFIIYAFTGGGIRSASFGYGVLEATHAVSVPDSMGAHTLDRDIDIVSGVSGGSFTAAAFAYKRQALFPASETAPDYYRKNFLEHDFDDDLIAIYLEPWRWQWMLPDYGTNDEMAKVYGDIGFSSDSDKLFGESFGDLARLGRPFLIVQATDFGNEQPFTFTQNDFDLICSDVDAYPVRNAVAASAGFPILFTPIQLTNHHFASSSSIESDPKSASLTPYCRNHRPQWVDQVLSIKNPPELSRTFARAQVAEGYLPPAAPAQKQAENSANPNKLKSAMARLFAQPQYVYLQDGGVADNVALRGLMDIVAESVDNDAAASDEWSPEAAAGACSAGFGRVRKIIIVSVDGQAEPDNSVSSLPYLSGIGQIMDLATSTAIDANDFETMLAADAMTKRLALKLAKLPCFAPPASGSAAVTPYFARLSFRNLSESTPLPKLANCGSDGKQTCTVGDLARSGTSLHFSPDQVDALIEAGRSAFWCDPEIRRFLTDSGAAWSEKNQLACAGE
jgi:predicted acylesterase/phospholipase RssA